MTLGSNTASKDTSQRTSGGFRSDIQGMRAIAVLIVFLYHLGVPGMDGGYVGVDVFLVLSGFLITGQLDRELKSTKNFNGSSFYGRRIRRLLPASAVVFVASCVAAGLLLSPVLVQRNIREYIFAAGFLANLHYALNGVSYLAASSIPPLFQHYWSLALEEQFYVVWPWLMLWNHRLSSKLKLNFDSIPVLLLILSLASFSVSVILTRTYQPVAFFLLPARAWEFGLGGLLAVVSIPNLPSGFRVFLRSLGCVLLGIAVYAFDSTTSFPGTAALLPTMATVCLLVAGQQGSARGPVDWILNAEIMQFFGKISYSLYLWHWPVLVFLEILSPGENWVVRGAVAVVIVLLAAASERFVEDRWRRPRPSPSSEKPVRRFIPGRPEMVLLGCLLLSSAGAVTFAAWWTSSIDYGPSASPVEVGGMSDALLAEVSVVPENVVPELFIARSDRPLLYEINCHRAKRSEDASACIFGTDLSSPTVVLFGDSHAAQWFPSLRQAAENGDIVLETYTKSACVSADIQVHDARLGRLYWECDNWRASVVQSLVATPPDLIILSNYAGQHEPAEWRAGLERTLEALGGNTKVLIIGQTPGVPGDTPVCLGGNLRSPAACGSEYSESIDVSILDAERSLATRPEVGFANPADWLCLSGICPAIAGNIVLYSDDDHLTATAAALLAPEVIDRLNLDG